MCPALAGGFLTTAPPGKPDDDDDDFLINLFLSALGLHCCMWAFSSCGVQASHCSGFSCCGARALGVQASVVEAHGLSSCGSQALECRLNSCGTRA